MAHLTSLPPCARLVKIEQMIVIAEMRLTPFLREFDRRRGAECDSSAAEAMTNAVEVRLGVLNASRALRLQ